MAIPKVFVSSTCYDLQEERAQLERFITNYGFHPILSEYSGVYYDVDAHTHESCVNEVAHCDMFVLIISGRYGGKFKNGNGESITQAEYNKARELGLPIFTFVKADVSAAQHYFKENVRANDEEFAKKINYPAIEKQADAVSIFSFIDSVHRASTNNGLETYKTFTDIEDHLKKQWAGMFFSFLQKRKEQDKVEEMTTILEKLAGSSTKLEVLVSSLHDNSVGEDNTSKLLEKSQQHEDCVKFFQLIMKIVDKSLWELSDDKVAHQAHLKLAIEDLRDTTFEPDLDKYLLNLSSLRLILANSNGNQTGKNVIHFKNLNSVGSFIQSDWLKVQALYNKSILKADQEMIDQALEEVANNLGVIL